MKRYLPARITLIVLFAFVYSANYAQNSRTGKIKILDFKVENVAHGINVYWATENSNSGNYFEVERSNDGKKFKTMAIILGPDPQKSEKEYDFVDKKITKNTSYYRVKHISSTGETQFSETKMISLK